MIATMDWCFERKTVVKILVTGASGFIGSAFIRKLAADENHDLVALVRHSDTRNLSRLPRDLLRDSLTSGKLRIIYGDLNRDISGISEGCDAVVHFAAKTFVDHSIRDPWPFIESNLIGTYKILEDAKRNKVGRFIQVSTDEVYGPILSGAWDENARINPTNPYSATKAGADALVVSYTHTFGLWTAITRTENNYGPYQNPQKAIPAFVRRLLKNQKIQLYGDGLHRRQWLWVDDHVSAIELLLTAKVDPAQIFHVAGAQELENIDLAERIISFMFPTLPPIDWQSKIELVNDSEIRPGHDRRYALSCDKMHKLGWRPKVLIDGGIEKAVDWYMKNRYWLE